MALPSHVTLHPLPFGMGLPVVASVMRLVSGGLDCQVIIWKPNEGGFVKEKILKLHTDFVGTPGARRDGEQVVRYFCLQIGRDSQNTPMGINTLKLYIYTHIYALFTYIHISISINIKDNTI